MIIKTLWWQHCRGHLAEIAIQHDDYLYNNIEWCVDSWNNAEHSTACELWPVQRDGGGNLREGPLSEPVSRSDKKSRLECSRKPLSQRLASWWPSTSREYDSRDPSNELERRGKLKSKVVEGNAVPFIQSSCKIPLAFHEWRQYNPYTFCSQLCY